MNEILINLEKVRVSYPNKRYWPRSKSKYWAKYRYEIKHNKSWNSIIKLIYMVLFDGARKGADEIHIDGRPVTVSGNGSPRVVGKIQFRIENVLYEVMRPPAKLFPSMRAYLRYVSGLGTELLLIEETKRRSERWLMYGKRALEYFQPPKKQPGEFRIRTSTGLVLEFQAWITENNVRMTLRVVSGNTKGL